MVMNIVMAECIGTKKVKAAPITKGDYNKLRGWETPENEDASENGYLVEYTDSVSNHLDFSGYISWSPKQVFEEAYYRYDNLDFGKALHLLKEGKKLARAGWNGKGMFIYYVPENKYPASGNTLGTMKGIFPDDMVPYGAYIAMKTAQGNVVPWLASQTDVLAEDWVVIDG